MNQEENDLRIVSESIRSRAVALSYLKHDPVSSIEGVLVGSFACVGCQATLCDPIWQATPCSSVMGLPIMNLSWLF